MIALHATREMLARSGHQVSVSWPEIWQHDGGTPEECHPAELVDGADVLIHASPPDEEDLPAEVERARQAGKPFIRYLPGAPCAPSSDGACSTITSIEDLPAALETTIDASLQVG